MTRLVCISDTHTRTNFQVPDGDVLIHSGDATFRGDYSEVWDFARWYGEFPHEHKIFVAGNHDWGFEKQPEIFRKMMSDNNITYLQDSGMEIRGLIFYGSPWQPEFGGWAFNLSRFEGELTHKWAIIPDDTNVLITHGPPKGILDLTAGYDCMTPSGVDHEPPERVGCWDLTERVRKLKSLRAHIFGHIHHSYGKEVIDGVTYLNSSICNEQYKAVNAPHVIDV